MSAARATRRPRRPRLLPDGFPSAVASPGGFWLSHVLRDSMQRDALTKAMEKAHDNEPLWFGLLKGCNVLDARINEGFEIIQRSGDLLRVIPIRRGAA